MRYCLLASVMIAMAAHAERVVLTSEQASCVVETFGARVVSFVTGGQERLWTPETPFATNVWQHGGIPLAWPWFGRIGAGDGDIHGYAWRMPFSVRSRRTDALTLALDTGALELEYTVRLAGDRLMLTARTTNHSRFPQPFAVAYHPYFRVGELSRCRIDGVTDGSLVVTEAIDSAVNYGTTQARRVFVLDDSARSGRLEIAAEGLTGVNVWNPGEAKKCPGVIFGDEWRRFVAIEPYARGFNRFSVLEPGGSSTLHLALCQP